MNTPVRLIATDLDGTLVHSEGRVSAANRAALERVRSIGIHVVVCTGRRHSYAMRVLRDDVLRGDEIIVSSNGAVGRTFSGELLWRETLHAALVRRLCQVVNAYRNSLVLTFDRSGPDGTDAPGALAVEELDTLHGSIRRWMESNAHSLQRFNVIEDALAEGVMPIQAMLCGKVERMREAERLLQEGLANEVQTFRTEYADSDLCILDIVPRDVSKGAALRRVAERLGAPMDTVLALGDNWNDLSMLEAAGQRQMLENAPAELLQIARERQWPVAPAGDADGFAAVIQAVLPGSP